MTTDLQSPSTSYISTESWTSVGKYRYGIPLRSTASSPATCWPRASLRPATLNYETSRAVPWPTASNRGMIDRAFPQIQTQIQRQGRTWTPIPSISSTAASTTGFSGDERGALAQPGYRRLWTLQQQRKHVAADLPDGRVHRPTRAHLRRGRLLPGHAGDQAPELGRQPTVPGQRTGGAVRPALRLVEHHHQQQRLHRRPRVQNGPTASSRVPRA